MNIDELIKYVVTQLQSGINPNDISTQLRAAGWPEEAINSALTAAHQQLTPIAQPIIEQPSIEQPIEANAQPIQQTPAVVPTSTGRGKMKTGWLLFKQCFGIIKHTPALWRYMVMIMVWNVSITIIFVAVVIVDNMSTQILSRDIDGDLTFNLFGLILSIVIGYILTVLTYFYATALSVHTLSIFRGEQTTYKDSIVKTRKKLPTILTYAIIATIIGYILRFIEDKSKLVGLIVAQIIGLLWSLAVTFTLPLIADSNLGGIGCIKQSIFLFKKTWGETITSRVSLGGLIFLIYFLVMIPVSIFLGILFINAMGATGVIIAVALFLCGAIILSTAEALASNVLNVALYYYAQYNVIPPSFNAELLSSALVMKSAKKGLF